MFPQIWQRVVRGDYGSAPARVDGYARYAIAGETYPGMIRQSGTRVQGVLYFDVTDTDIAALDTFEGAEYRREAVRATLENGESIDAATYIYLLPEKLLQSPWTPEAFQMERFIGTYCAGRFGE